MKCVHPFGTDRHKRQADITLLFQYISCGPHGFVEVFFNYYIVYMAGGAVFTPGT